MPLQTFPVEGQGSYHPMPDERSLSISAPGANVVAVDKGQAHFTTDALHGVTATLIATDGVQYVYSGMASYAGVERAVTPGEVLGKLGPNPLTFVVTTSSGPVDPAPLLDALSKNPPDPLPDLPVAPVPPVPGKLATRPTNTPTSKPSFSPWLIVAALLLWSRRRA
jgi:hypothetical protein